MEYRDDGGTAGVALLHELEKDVGLLRLDVQVAQLVDDQQRICGQFVDELARGAVRQGGVHLVEQVLRLDEQPPVAILEGLEQDPRGEAGLAHPGPADEHDVLGLGDELQFGEGADLALVDRGLLFVGKGLQAPGLRQAGRADPIGQGRLLAVVPLGPEQPGEEFLVGGLGLGRFRQFLVQDVGYPAEVQVLEQLLDIILHRVSPRIRRHRLR